MTNTTETLKKGKSNGELAKETKEAVKKFKGEKTVKVAIPTVLVPKIGNVLFLSINGVSVNVPVDGNEHDIPQTHANHLKQYLKDLK